MADQKIDNLLNLAMDATPQERRKSGNLNVGYDPATRLWDVIIKYSGPESGPGWKWNSGSATVRRLCSGNFAGIVRLISILPQSAGGIYGEAKTVVF